MRQIFVNSNPTAERLIRKFSLDRSSVRVVHPGIDEIFFQTPSPKSGDTFRILTVCRLNSTNRRKNVDNTIRAVARIKEFPVQLTIIGGGDDRLRLEQLVTRLNCEPRIRFLGKVAHDELLKNYQDHDLFVLVPRHGWFDIEGFGIVYIEACAAGLPSLGAKYGGCMDAIKPGVTGSLLPSASAHAIENGIRLMYDHRHQFSYERMREFTQQFRWPRVGQKLFQHIERALTKLAT